MARILYPGAKRGISDVLVSDVFVRNMNLRNVSLSSYTKGIDRGYLKQKGNVLYFITSLFMYVCMLPPITFIL